MFVVHLLLDGWVGACTHAEVHAALSAELQKLASKAVNRAHVKRTAGIELAATKGYAASYAYLT